MKEVLIYGALVAAVLGASINVIGGLTQQMEDSGTQITQSVKDRVDTLLGGNSGS